MIYTLTLNPSLDYVMDVDHFMCGIINRTTEERILPGGKGINVSVVLKNLGYDNTALGFCADFTGEELKRCLKNKGIVPDLIPVSKGMTRINVKLCSKEETEINAKGPVIEEKEIELLYKKLNLLKEGDILVLSGSVPANIPTTIYREIMEYLMEKRLKIIVDAVGQVLLETLPYKPFLIKPNHYELGELFDIVIDGKEDAVFYGKKLQEMGAENVLVSMGGAGAVLIAGDGMVYEAQAPEGEVKNTVGAGDSMVAGFLAGYLETEDYKNAFHMGICAGSASSFSDELATRNEVIELLKIGL